MTAAGKPVVVAVPGDLHLTEPGLDNARVAQEVIDELNVLVRPDFVQFIGDNVQDAAASQFELFDALRRQLDAPHFALVGDHDVKDDPAASVFRHYVGEPCGAHTIRGIRFLRLNTQEARPVGLGPAQIAWLREEVDVALARGERVVLFQHNYPYQIWEDFAGPGVDDWQAVVQTRRVEAIVCGHTHYFQVANDGRNVAVATRSIGDPEGGPPGYTLLYFHGDDLALTFRTPGSPGPVVLVTHPRDRLLATGPTHVVKGPDRVSARVWSAEPVESVRYRVDGGVPNALEPVGDGQWTAPLTADSLDKGEHTLEVVATTRGGTTGEQTIAFMADPTGRYTAVPEARPVVRSTAFC